MGIYICTKVYLLLQVEYFGTLPPNIFSIIRNVNVETFVVFFFLLITSKPQKNVDRPKKLLLSHQGSKVTGRCVWSGYSKNRKAFKRNSFWPTRHNGLVMWSASFPRIQVCFVSSWVSSLTKVCSKCVSSYFWGLALIGFCGNVVHVI